MRALAVLLLLTPFACESTRPVTPPSGGRDATTTSSRADAQSAADAEVGADALPIGADALPIGDAGSSGGPVGVELLGRLAGLWSGPGTGTVLGDFPRIVMDFRAADDKTLFARVDLDANNALRMAFYVEGDTLVFRNGGLFMGLSRDTITRLVESDAAAGRYRFCEATRGCDYNEAILELPSPTQLVMTVTVRRMMHLRWSPSRQEPRELPPVFPAPGGVVPGAPFPPMPTLAATVRWSTPLAAAADVVLILSVTDCSFTACAVSRHFSASAMPGATSATFRIDQLHAGPYKAFAFVDRDRNVGSTLAPDSGDGVTLPNQALTIAPSGETSWSGSIVYDLP